MEKLTLHLENLSCPVCAEKVGKLLNKLQGIDKADVFFTTGKAKIIYDPAIIPSSEIIKAIGKLGYNAKEK